MNESGDSGDDLKKKKKEKKYLQFSLENESDDESNKDKTEINTKSSHASKKYKQSKLFKKPSFSKGRYL